MRIASRHPVALLARSGLVALVLALVAGCSPGESPSTTDGAKGGDQPGDAGADGPSPVELPQFVEVGEQAGCDVENHSGKPKQKDWIVSGMGGGIIVLDYDRDGDMDFVVVDGTMITEDGVIEYDDAWKTRLLRNDTTADGLKFTDVTDAAGVGIKSFGFGGASCDYDADGWPDFHVSTWGRNYLFHNRGDGTFEDVTERAGLLGDPGEMSTACSWGDLNGDGIHDLYVSNYCDQHAQIAEVAEKRKKDPGVKARACDWRGYKVYCGPPGLPPQADRLYFGNGDGTFRDVTATSLQLAPETEHRFGFQSIMTDVDADGDLDIYVANDTQDNYLWINDGKGVFTDMALEAGVATSRDVMPQAGMGVDAADVDRDGRIDLFVTNFSHDYNTLYMNHTRGGRPSFRDLSHNFKVAKLAYLRLCWGTRLWDYDNDGELDMFVACGHVYGEIANFPQTGTSYEQKNLLLRNLGPPSHGFTDVTDRSGTAFQLRRVWRGAAFADFDDDGDQDVLVTALNEKAALYRNDGGNRNAFLRFRLQGKGNQLDPSGARVWVHPADGRVRLEELHHGASFCSDNDPRLFFGLRNEETVSKVVVRWPGGEEQTFENVKTRAMYRIEQGNPELIPDGPKR